MTRSSAATRPRRRAPTPCPTPALLLLLLAASAAPALEPVQSPADERSYEHFVLDNGMQALVISDPAADKAAAAVDVQVGSSADPADRQGLAHFLEHMLFLGTEKYPEAGEYQAFISRHGGRHNAYTGFENTNYFFEIEKDHLEPALDRFSQFFVAPLFNEDYVEREMNAVHSEYQAKLRDDDRRLYAVWKAVANPKHPFARFNVGSLETLADRPGDPVREDLLAFYHDYYAARRMNVVVLGAEPLATLRRWVEERFGEVPNPEPAPLAIEAPLFEPGALPMRLDVEPIKEQRRLMLSFPLPPTRAHYRVKPLDYIGNLAGHEGEGSLLSSLKRAGWAEALSAGTGLDHRDASVFALDIELTAAGLENLGAVKDRIFAFLALLRAQGIESWRYEEQQQIGALRFRFEEKPAALGLVSRLASDLHHVAPRDVLRAPYAYDRFDRALIADLAARLVPDNALVTVMAPGVASERTERWYGTPYAVRPAGAGAAAAREPGDAGLALPEPNPFIVEPGALALLDSDAERPLRVPDQSAVQLWHYPDSSFAQPRAAFYFSVRSAFANDNPRHAMLSELYVRLIKDQLNELTYPATLADLHFDIYRHVRGFTVKLHGLNGKQARLLEAIVPRLREPELRERRFAAIKAELRREIANRRQDRPYRQTTRSVTELLLEPSWTTEQQLAALEPLGVEDLAHYLPVLFQRIELVALSHGHVPRSKARAMAGRLRAGLLAEGQQAVAVPPARIVKLNAGDDYLRVLDIEHPDSAATVYFQAPDKEVRTRALTELIAQLVRAPFYTDLRTEKQLGYIVSAGPSHLLEVPGLVFIVQSPVAAPGVLQGYIQAFLHDFAAALPAMGAAELQAHKQGLISRLSQADERLLERTERLWQELDLGYEEFDSRERLVAAIEPLDKTALVTALERWIVGPESRRLSIVAAGAGELELARSPAPVLIEHPASLGQFKQTYSGTRGPDRFPAAGEAVTRPAGD